MGTDFCDEWGYITFSFIGVPIDEFADTKTLVLRYGASGSGADDWENRYLSVKLVYKK